MSYLLKCAFITGVFVFIAANCFGAAASGYGQVFLSGGGSPADGTCTFFAYLRNDMSTIITEDGFNSDQGLNGGYGSGYWLVNFSNFPGGIDGVPYSIELSAENDGEFGLKTGTVPSSYSDQGTITLSLDTNVPAKPSTPQTQAFSDHVTLSWTAETNLTYHIYRAIYSSGAFNGASSGLYNRIAANVTPPYTDLSVLSGGTYWYLLVAESATGKLSPHSDETFQVQIPLGTATPAPTETNTPVSTDTPTAGPDTPTPTVSPTPPTPLVTDTPTIQATDTQTRTPTDTPVPPSQTPSPTETPTPTHRCEDLDSYEPDDTPDDANLLLMDGHQQTHYLCSPTDEDWMRFMSIRDGKAVITTLNLGPGVDTIMYLYEFIPPVPTPLTSNDNYQTGNLASQITWDIIGSVEYLLVVRSASSSVPPRIDSYYDVQCVFSLLTPTPSPTTTATPRDTETPTPEPTETPTYTSTPSPEPTDTATPAERPALALAGYWNTAISNMGGGVFTMWAIVWDKNGAGIPPVEVYFQNAPVGVTLSNLIQSNGFVVYSLPEIAIDPGVPPGRIPLELLAADNLGNHSYLWPYLNVE